MLVHCLLFATDREGDTLDAQMLKVWQLTTNVEHRIKPLKQVAAKVKLGDLGTRLGYDALLLILSPRGSDLQVLKDDGGEHGRICLLPPDLLEADLLRTLTKEDDLLGCPPAVGKGILGGVLVVDGSQKVPRRVSRARRPNKGCSGGGI